MSGSRAEKIRRAAVGDVEVVSTLIRRCLREVNSRDYPADVIERMCAHFDAATIRRLHEAREMYVAEVDGQVVATVSRLRNLVFTIFVDPDYHGMGVGRRLMDHVEQLAAADGYILADLRDEGEVVSGRTLAKLMRRHGIVGISPRKWTPVTTVQGIDQAPCPDRVNRQFDTGVAERRLDLRHHLPRH